MLRTFLILLLSCCLISANAQDHPEKMKGLLWEISGHGIARPGYLYGTMHVPEKLAFNLSDSFFVALKQADIVALETDHDQWQAFTSMLNDREVDIWSQAGSDFSNKQPSSQQDLYNTLFRFPVPDNQLLGAMLSSKPRMTNEFLYRTNQYRQDYEEDTYLDLFIFQAGRKLGKKVMGLETMEGSYEAYVRAQMPDDVDDRESKNRYTPSLYPPVTLEDAYRDQNLSLIDSLNKMMRPSKNFQRWMLDERNKIMAAGIDSVLQSGASLFSAVGAAHLPGDGGLIQTLRKMGYSLRPVQFSTEHSKQEKESIEVLRFPVQFSRQWDADSSWSVETPGKFYQTVDALGLEQQLCADMSNGAYYAVYQLHTFGPWIGQSPEYIAERLDSLIYEKIPGKIQERKRLTQPYPGHEITTRTRRGDIMRYKIFVAPMNIFVFATGGNGNYAAGEEGTRFLNSIRFDRLVADPGKRDTTISPPQGGFQITFPAPPNANTTTDPKADRFYIAATDPTDSAFYILYRADYHDWGYIEEDTFELNIIGEMIAAQFSEKPPQTQLVCSTPFPTQNISFRADRDSAWYFLQLVIDGPHYYMLGCRKQTPAPPERFFQSFSIVPNRYPEHWEELTDTVRMFWVSVPPAAVPSVNPFLTKLRRIVEEGFRKKQRGSDFFPMPEKILTRTFKLPLYGEEIFVQSTEISAARGVPTLDSFQTFWQKRLSGFYKMTIREKSWATTSPGLMVGNFILADTNSTRGIRAKVFVTPGRVYSLLATVHLDRPESPFIEAVFDRFTPTDTTRGPLPFGKPNRVFLQNIYSADSLLREKALKNLENSWNKNLEDADFPAVRAAIEHPDFGKLRFTQRSRLLALAGSFHSSEALSFALDFFRQYPDSVRYRQAILTALAQMQTRPAFDALLRQLLREPVYLTSDGVSDIFEALGDTLDLSAHLFPTALALEQEDVFREPLLDLLDQLQDKKLIRPDKYSRLKPALIRETAVFLSRMQYESENQADTNDSDLYHLDSNNDTWDGPGAHLTRNLRLLAPFVQKDKRVKALFDRAREADNKNIQIASLCLLLQNGMPVRSEALHAFVGKDRTRIILYRQLLGTNQLAPYATWFSDTIALVRSVLSVESAGLDSFRFISVHRTVRNGALSALYFFDVKGEKDTGWRLASITLPLNARIFGTPSGQSNHSNSEVSYQSYLDRPDVKVLPEMPEQEKEAYIRKKIGESRFLTRERYQDPEGRAGW